MWAETASEDGATRRSLLSEEKGVQGAKKWGGTGLRILSAERKLRIVGKLKASLKINLVYLTFFSFFFLRRFYTCIFFFYLEYKSIWKLQLSQFFSRWRITALVSFTLDLPPSSNAYVFICSYGLARKK